MANSRRVRWLERGYRALREEILQDAPARVCVSVSVTTTRRAIGQCFNQYLGPDGKHFLAIHPKNFTDPVEVLRVELHEMVHTLTNGGHGKEFARVALGLGFLRPMRITPAGPELLKKLKAIAEKLGPLPKADWQEPGIPVPVMIVCACPRTLTVTPDFLKAGNIKCMKCKKIFREKRG